MQTAELEADTSSSDKLETLESFAYGVKDFLTLLQCSMFEYWSDRRGHISVRYYFLNAKVLKSPPMVSFLTLLICDPD